MAKRKKAALTSPANHHPMALNKLTAFYRSCLFQIIIVGLVGFCEPGIWTALNNLGAGGNASATLNNAANALTYGLMSIGCALCGGVSNYITPKWTLVLGAAFYTPYAAGLYCNNRFGNEWFLLLGAGLCGVGASLLWASEAAIAVGYPEEAKRGKYVGIWMGIRQLGPLVGGAISLAINVNTAHTGKVSYKTYQGLIAISSLGAPFALLLSQPRDVIRSDGTAVPYLRKTNVAIEARGIWKLLRTPYLVLLYPIFLAGQFGTTYQGNYLTNNFTVRSRALASFLSAVVGLTANLLTGALLDLKLTATIKSRAIYLGIAIVVTTAWIWNAVVEVDISNRSTAPDLDLGDGGFFNSAFAVYILFKFFYEAMQTYIYWLLGAKKGTQKNGEVSRMTGIMRSWESIGSAIAYGIGASSVSNRNQMIIAFALWIFTIPPTLMVVFGKWDLTVDDGEKGDDSDQDGESSGSDVGAAAVITTESKV
ncbi:MFS general substrate transporter [Aureobasidium pullulans]|uniref:MFS general substrate transporter n=1 Tax=Aureobasidium pullulans TaxID=5580 RepID=A0A4V4L0C6_AURPU|nr:MFS general substrate transporter [Aureobasidium pullulans]